MKTRTKTVNVGDWVYFIYTEEEGGLFVGSWTEQVTGGTGGSSKECKTSDEALLLGENNARMDYAFKHPKQD